MEGVRFAVLGWVDEVTSECHEWTIPTYSTYPCLRIKQKPAYQGLLGHQMHNTHVCVSRRGGASAVWRPFTLDRSGKADRGGAHARFAGYALMLGA